MQRLIVKTAVKTVLILLGIVIAVFAIFNFAFPQHMATAMETLGNYGMAVKYANLRYVYTNDSMDLARCYDDSVLAEDDGAIIYYAEKLIDDFYYDHVCAVRNGTYNDMYSDQFGFNFDYDLRVRSTLSASYYNEAVKLNGSERVEYTQKAVDFALQANGTNRFPYGNALMVLAISVTNQNDSVAANMMLVALDGVTTENSQEGDYLTYFKSKLRGVSA